MALDPQLLHYVDACAPGGPQHGRQRTRYWFGLTPVLPIRSGHEHERAGLAAGL